MEVIVVDGGSDDATVELAKKYTNNVIVSPVKGRASQMNYGASIAIGKTLLFLHSDTFLPDPALPTESIFPFLDKENIWGFYPVKLNGTHVLFRVIATMMNMRSRLTSVATGDQCLFVERNFFVRQGGFCDIPLMEDVDICKRLRKKARPLIAKIPIVTSSRRWEEKGIVKTILLMWYLRALYFLGVPPKNLVKRYYSN